MCFNLVVANSIESTVFGEAMDEEAPLVAERSDSKTTTKNHTRDIHILSSAFLFIFLAYGAAQNLESTINTVSSNSAF